MKAFSILLAVWHLTFTIPTHLINGDTLTDYSHVKLYRAHQSPTWVPMKPAMLADTSVWNHFWPIVIVEAEPIWYNDYTTSPITLPDSLPTNYNYYLVVVRKTGAYSIPSNWAGR